MNLSPCVIPQVKHSFIYLFVKSIRLIYGFLSTRPNSGVNRHLTISPNSTVCFIRCSELPSFIRLQFKNLLLIDTDLKPDQSTQNFAAGINIWTNVSSGKPIWISSWSPTHESLHITSCVFDIRRLFQEEISQVPTNLLTLLQRAFEILLW